MAKNQILTSSDHHANWNALDELFQIAQEKEIPFVINGDIIGDYNFDEIKSQLNLKYPYEVLREPLEEITKELTISTNTMRLKALYQIIIKFHAKILAKLIDKYQVKTYFLLGNHEPANFVDLTIQYLENKSLLKDLGKIEKIENANGIRIAGIPNVCAIMPFISDIFTDEETLKMFPHQMEDKPLLFKNITKEYLTNSTEHLYDSDWIRIMKDENDFPELDIFFTHGQIGIGAWRDDKQASEMPTLHAAAKLSEISKLTIDGHLHSTHQMKNPLDKETIRAVGNKGFILTKKENGEIEKELIKVDAPYDNRGKVNLNHLDLEQEIFNELLN